MNSDPLDNLLCAYSRQAIHSPTKDQRAAVWRRIHAQRHGRRSWADIFPIRGWREMFAEPKLASAGLALALLTGIVPVAAAASFIETPRIARDSLHLQVFTAVPSCMPKDVIKVDVRP